MAARLHTSDAKSTAVRKRIEKHKFEDEEGEEYKASRFGGFNDYFRRKKIKLQNLDVEIRANAPDLPPIFRGVVCHVNGYTQPSLNDLHKLIVTHEGAFLQYLDGKTAVTHIIASSLTPKKRVEFRRYRIVKPAWVVDSVKAGKLLPWDDYRVVDEGVGQKVLGFEHGMVVSQVNGQQAGYREQTDRSWYTSQLQQMNEPQVDGQDEDAFSALSAASSLSGHNGYHEKASKELEPAGAELPYPEHEPKSKGDLRSDSETLTTVDLSAEPAFSSHMDGQEVDQSEPVPSSEVHQTDDGSLVGGAGLPLSKSAGERLLKRSKPSSESDKTQLLRSHSSDSSTTKKVKDNMTAEEHNSVLLADPHMWKSSTVNPNFIQQYYSESRLHHLSTWKANLKAQLQQMTKDLSASQKARQKCPPGARRYIMHVDFDSFFAAVSLKKAPQYKDKPVVIAHGSGQNSEIASCNYPAREFGVKNGMWMKNAFKLCPKLHVLPYDFKAYEAASKEFYSVILDTGGIVQSVSVDEALVDVSILCTAVGGSKGIGLSEGSIWREQEQADKIALSLRTAVRGKTGCEVSVGIGANILLAKLALRKAKPAGQYQLKPENVLDFIGNLTVRDLPGVAHSIGGKLEELGIKYIKDIRSLSKERLTSALGPKTGEKIWDYSRGIDRTEVGEQVIRKSVSAEVNWGVRFETQAQAEEFVTSLCGELHKRLLNQMVKGKQMTMKIMRRAADAPLDPPKQLGHGKCDTFNKSVALNVATNSQEVLVKEALSILRSFGFSPGELRGIGLQMTRLEPLKASGYKEEESSQRRLRFRAPDAGANTGDDVLIPSKVAAEPQVVTTSPAVEPGAAHTKSKEITSERLSPMGTQFVIPSQIDPSVLEALPEEIRSKLGKVQAERNLQSEARSRVRLGSDSPGLYPVALPTADQLDEETLAELPKEAQQEILSAYKRLRPRAQNQALLPQSPRKVRHIAPSSKKITTPTKRRTGLLSRGRRKADAYSTTLTQSNFVAKQAITGLKAEDKQDPFTSGTDDGHEPPPSPLASVAQDVLDALPEDLRHELLAQQKRDRLRQRARLTLPSPRKHHSRRPAAEEHLIQRRIRLAPPPPKPTFTSRKLSTLPELQDAIMHWAGEFQDGPPQREDIDALARYLSRVVKEGQDMAHAVGVVRWLDWVVQDEDRALEGAAKLGWEAAVETIKQAVQEAVGWRGLGPLAF